MTIPYKRVLVIINPAAGHDEPILNTLNDVFHSAGVDWDIRITHKFGDATRLAKEAVEMGVDLVAGYGGDGTQMEVANGLLGSGIPLAILPVRHWQRHGSRSEYSDQSATGGGINRLQSQAPRRRPGEDWRQGFHAARLRWSKIPGRSQQRRQR